MSGLLDTTVRISLLIICALAANAALRRRSAALRHWVLAAALACATVMPALALIVPSWHLGLFVPTTMSQSHSPRAAVLIEQSQLPVASSDVAARTFTVREAAEADRKGPPRIFDYLASAPVVPVWLAGVVGSVFVLLVGLARLSWLASRSQPLREGTWRDMATAIADEYGVRRPVLLLQSSHPTLLVTWGLMRHKVILPATAGAWTPERIRIVLSHELAHIRRRDWVVQLVVQLLRAVYWFNPFLWMASARLRQESEQACDDAVLRLGIDGSAYATHLLELARSFSHERRVWSPAPAIARPSSLERRVRAMLNARIDRDPVTRSASTAAMIALLTMALAIAGFNASAQTFSTLSGSVVDQQGALLPGVTLVLTNAQTQAKYEVRSTQTGQFEFVGIPSGEFMLSARFPGFKTLDDRVSVAGRNLQRDLTLQLGTLEETITVIGDATTGERRSVPPVTEDARAGFRNALAQCSAFAAGAAPAIGGKIRPPRKIRHVRPVYPEGLRAAGIGGVVKLEALIGADGRVKEVQPVPSQSVDPGLVTAAIDAVNEWEFDGTLLNCRPVEVSMDVSVSFSPGP